MTSPAPIVTIPAAPADPRDARIHQLEEELFEERMAYGLLREKYDQLEEASIGVLDIRDQLHRVQRYLMARGIDYQAVSAGRLQ